MNVQQQIGSDTTLGALFRGIDATPKGTNTYVVTVLSPADAELLVARVVNDEEQYKKAKAVGEQLLALDSTQATPSEKDRATVVLDALETVRAAHMAAAQTQISSLAASFANSELLNAAFRGEKQTPKVSTGENTNDTVRVTIEVSVPNETESAAFAQQIQQANAVDQAKTIAAAILAENSVASESEKKRAQAILDAIELLPTKTTTVSSSSNNNNNTGSNTGSTQNNTQSNQNAQNSAFEMEWWHWLIVGLVALALLAAIIGAIAAAARKRSKASDAEKRMKLLETRYPPLSEYPDSPYA